MTTDALYVVSFVLPPSKKYEYIFSRRVHTSIPVTKEQVNSIFLNFLLNMKDISTLSHVDLGYPFGPSPQNLEDCTKYFPTIPKNILIPVKWMKAAILSYAPHVKEAQS